MAEAPRSEVQTRVRDAEQAAKDEVWAGYRFVALADTEKEHELKVIDLGTGHSSASETLCGRVLGALKAEALLNENVGGYIDRHWPSTFKDTAAWPLKSLRQSFLNGALTRLIDPDAILRRQIVEFVSKGDFGLASGTKNDGSYERLWYAEPHRAVVSALCGSGGYSRPTRTSPRSPRRPHESGARTGATARS